MQMLAVSSLIAVAMMFSVAQAAMYRCEVDGKPQFSDRPCGDETQQVEVDYYEPDVSTIEATRRRVESAQAHLDSIEERQRLERALRTAESQIRSLRSQRDSELDALRAKKDSANNNLAGAVWEQSISQEMTAVAERYSSDIDSAQAEVDRLRRALEQF